jgi:Flp pilus assembly protein TadD
LCAIHIAQGNLVAAEDQCDLGLQFSPQYADLWVNKGIIAHKRGQDDKAKEALIKALRLNNEQQQAYNNLGIIYYNDRAYGKAHDNFQRALRVNPDYLDARYNLALTYRGMGDLDNARKEFRTLVQIRPDLADPYAQLGQISLEEGDAEVAVEALNRATQIDPKFVAAWLSLGNAYMELGRPCDGKDAFSTCIEVDENNPQCRNNIVLAEKRCMLQDKAFVDLKERQAGNKTPQSEYAAGLQFREKGLLNDEERAYKRCVRFDPKFVQCHFGLFELYKNRSDERNATIACKNFLKFANETDFQTQLATCRQYVRD